MKRSWSHEIALTSYEWLWRGATPFLSRHHRLREGLPQRLGRSFPEGPYDLWIQAASAGESFLASLLLDGLVAKGPYHVLVTTNTRQGKDIIDASIDRRHDPASGTRWTSAYFPFDRPALMRAAVDAVRPRLMVLLETEIWPGLMKALKTAGLPYIIFNGRLRPKSLRHYLLWPDFWRSLAPDRILAISPQDADRYARLFGPERVSVIPNMKFDRIRPARASTPSNPVGNLVPPGIPLIVLGSVRREEERAVHQMTTHLLAHNPDLVIGLFPRHMHRIHSWRARFASAGISCQLRSQTTSAAKPGSVLLWDVFGELPQAYAVARAAFVGGSLAPLGGQNFLEPLTCGLIPTIGPSWETFDWVGEDLFTQGLVRVASDWRGAADALLDLAANPLSRENVLSALETYLRDRRGGTAMSIAVIEAFLNRGGSAVERGGSN